MASKLVIEFFVVHDSLEIKFRANADTKLSKVWDSYIQSRKWQAGEKARFRLFLNESEGVRLSGTVQSNNIKEGTRLLVYQLDREELCTITICDQYGNEHQYSGWLEDDLEYWVDTFRSAVWARGFSASTPRGAQPTPKVVQLQEQYILYDSPSDQKVDMPRGRSPTLEAFADGNPVEGESGYRARFLCFRYLPKPQPAPLEVSFWLWNGRVISLEVDCDTPLVEAVNAATFMQYGGGMVNATVFNPNCVMLLRGWRPVDFTKGAKASVLLRRWGTDGSGPSGPQEDRENSDEEEEEEAAGARGRRAGLVAAGGRQRSVDVDYMCTMTAAGAIQVAAWTDTVPGHQFLGNVQAGDFSLQAAGPLYVAALNGAAKSAQALIEWGANPGGFNCGGRMTAEYAAAVRGHLDVLRVMLRMRPKELLELAQTYAALGRGLQQLARGMGGSRALALGCYCACQNVCQKKLLLLTQPGDRESLVMTQLSCVPLVGAARRGHIGVVAAMLEAGYPADMQDSGGESALHAAASIGHLGILELLLAAGACPHHRSLSGEQPIHAAALSGSVACVRALLAAGAEPMAVTDLLLPYDEVARISGRKFRNPSELGEWFKRQTRQSRSLMLDHAGILGGVTPLELAVGSRHTELVMVLLDAIGCTAKNPLTKAKGDMLQSLWAMAYRLGDTATAAALLVRFQECGGSAAATSAAAAGAAAAGGDGHLGSGRRPIGARARKAVRAVTRAAATSAADADSLFAAPDALLRGTKAAAPPPPPVMNKAARKAAARAARATQAAEEARTKRPPPPQQAQQHRVAEHAGTQLREYILQERQQLRKKLGLDQDSAAEAEAAGTVTATAAEQPGGGGASASAGESASSSELPCRCCLRSDVLDAALAPAAAKEEAARVAADKKGDASSAGGGGGGGAVWCCVDPEGATVGPRQRRLVVRCSGGCQLDYHFPDCWRAVEALLRAARPDYHGLKGPTARSNAGPVACWSPGCGGTGTVLTATLMEGPAEQPRFRQQIYTSPAAAAAAQQQQTGSRAAGGGGGGAGEMDKTPEASETEAAAGGDGSHRKGARQKHWQEQSWWQEEFRQYDDEEEVGEVQEEAQEEEEERPRAAELVDLSAVKLVPFSRRLKDAIDARAVGGLGGGGGGGAGACTAALLLDDVEAAPLVDGGAGGGRKRGKRGLAGRVKLHLTDLHRGAGEDGAGGGSAKLSGEAEATGDGQQQQQWRQRGGAANGGGAWRDTSAVPFAVRPVWERGDAAPRGRDGTAGHTFGTSGTAAAGGGGGSWTGFDGPANGTKNHNHSSSSSASAAAAVAAAMAAAQTSQPPPLPPPASQTQFGSGPGNGSGEDGGGGGGGGGRGVASGRNRLKLTDEEFPSLLPGGGATATSGGPGPAAAADPIMAALQLLKVPGADIITPHLLLEGPCLRHLYGTLFCGRPRIADTQLAATLDRYAGMTAFQSFEGGAAVAVSFRTDNVAGAVAAGLGAGDAVGLLGPGSVAGGGGLTVSYLLEFPSDDALVREMLQAERAAGGGAGGRAGGVGGLGSRLKPDAKLFVPGDISGAGAAKAGAAAAGPVSQPAVSARSAPATAAATAAATARQQLATAGAVVHRDAAAYPLLPPPPPPRQQQVPQWQPPPPPPPASQLPAPPPAAALAHAVSSPAAVAFAAGNLSHSLSGTAQDRASCGSADGGGAWHGPGYGELPPAAVPTTAAFSLPFTSAETPSSWAARSVSPDMPPPPQAASAAATATPPAASASHPPPDSTATARLALLPATAGQAAALVPAAQSTPPGGTRVSIPKPVPIADPGQHPGGAADRHFGGAAAAAATVHPPGPTGTVRTADDPQLLFTSPAQLPHGVARPVHHIPWMALQTGGGTAAATHAAVTVAPSAPGPAGPHVATTPLPQFQGEKATHPTADVAGSLLPAAWAAAPGGPLDERGRYETGTALGRWPRQGTSDAEAEATKGLAIGAAVAGTTAHVAAVAAGGPAEEEGEDDTLADLLGLCLS